MSKLINLVFKAFYRSNAIPTFDVNSALKTKLKSICIQLDRMRGIGEIFSGSRVLYGPLILDFCVGSFPGGKYFSDTRRYVTYNVPTRGLFVVETKDSFVLWLAKLKYQKTCL